MARKAPTPAATHDAPSHEELSAMLTARDEEAAAAAFDERGDAPLPGYMDAVKVPQGEVPPPAKQYRVVAERVMVVGGAVVKFTPGTVISDSNQDVAWLKREGLQLDEV